MAFQDQVTGQINYNAAVGEAPINLTEPDPKGEAYRGIRGNQISMIFQEPMSTLSPVHTIGNQIGEVIMLHQGLQKQAARELVLDLLDRVGIADPRRRID